MSREAFTQFDYLLNAMELAGSSAHPSQERYGDKRLALFNYVRDLERRAQVPAGMVSNAAQKATEVDCWFRDIMKNSGRDTHYSQSVMREAAGQAHQLSAAIRDIAAALKEPKP